MNRDIQVLRNVARAPQRVHGFSLIELMIAMVLGLIVSGAAVALFYSNSRTYASTENLGRIQENARTAFELMARDVREAAGNSCGASTQAANPASIVLTDAANLWFSNATGGVRGYATGEAMPNLSIGTARGERVAGTQGIDLVSTFGNPVTIQSHNRTTAVFTMNTAAHGFAVGDIVMACDAQHGAIFQVRNVTGASIGHGSGGTFPGNCTSALGGIGPNCGANLYQYACERGGPAGVDCATELWTATLAELRASRWWIGNDGNGGTSLWQTVRTGTTETPMEIADGVTGMTLTYLVRNATGYVDAAAVANWPDVVAVRIELDMAGRDRPGADGAVIARAFDHTVTIRNRAL